MEIYYNSDESTYIHEVGKQRLNKVNLLRKARKAAVYYFQDRFGLTINLIGLLWMFRGMFI